MQKALLAAVGVFLIAGLSRQRERLIDLGHRVPPAVETWARPPPVGPLDSIDTPAIRD